METVFTVLHAGGKFEKSAYKVSGGLHGVGASVVNALSDHLEVTVHKNGKKYFQRYERGKPVSDLQELGSTEVNGTTVHFKPDATMFETTDFALGTEISRMKNAAYLTPGVTFTLIDERVDYHGRFCFEGGIKTWLDNLIDGQEVVSQPHYLEQEGKDILVECAFQFLNTTNENLLSFVNNIPTRDHGTHVVGFKNALLQRINELVKEKDKFNKKLGEFTLQDISDGLYAIVTVKIPEPQFQGQTKGKLGNSYVKTQMEKIMYEYITNFFSAHPEEFDRIFEKIELSARARLAAVIAKESIIRKNVLSGSPLP